MAMILKAALEMIFLPGGVVRTPMTSQTTPASGRHHPIQLVFAPD